MSEHSHERPLVVCYFGTYRANYSRNQIMIEGLQRNNVQIIECHEQLWQGISDRVQVASGGWFQFKFLWRVIRTYWRLLSKYTRVPNYDVMVLGYPGQFDVYLARMLTWLRGKPLVLDVFMSVYLIAQERELVKRHPLTGRLIRFLENLSCRLPDRLILDTAAYAQWFEETFHIEANRFDLVPTGADDRYYYPVDALPKQDDLFRVLYYGTFIPNHGVPLIVEAAKILKDYPRIQFELVGEGPMRAEASALVEKYELENVHMPGWVEKHELAQYVAQADVCLGAFGTTPQSLMTIQNKIYEALAMKKPLITGDSPTVRATFENGKHLLLCQRQDAHSLAESIAQLEQKPELREHLAEQGFARFIHHFTPQKLGQQTIEHLEQVRKGHR